MNKWNKPKQKLHETLIKHSSICIICKNELMLGYLSKGGIVHWWSNGEKNKIKTPWLAIIPHSIPTYICVNCGLLVGLYKFPIIEYNNIQTNEPSSKYITNNENCPFCNNKLENGVIYVSRIIGGPPLGLTWTNENNNIDFWKRSKYLTHVSPFKSRYLKSRRCSNCGAFFSRINLLDVQKRNRFRILIWLVLFSLSMSFLIIYYFSPY